MEAHAGNIIKKRLMSFAFEKTPHIGLSCKLVPVQYREYECGSLCNLPHSTDCMRVWTNRTVVTSQVNHQMIWIGWQQGFKHVSRIILCVRIYFILFYFILFYFIFKKSIDYFQDCTSNNSVLWFIVGPDVSVHTRTSRWLCCWKFSKN